MKAYILIVGSVALIFSFSVGAQPEDPIVIMPLACTITKHLEEQHCYVRPSDVVSQLANQIMSLQKVEEVVNKAIHHSAEKQKESWARALVLIRRPDVFAAVLPHRPDLVEQLDEKYKAETEKERDLFVGQIKKIFCSEQ